jgi:pimeloyl-ACP methyl ester carboxylesterase
MLPKREFTSTPLLHVEYLCWGANTGEPVILLHGWPDAASTWAPIAVGLAKKGYRVYAPSLRGFGQTTFRDQDTMRSGQLAALGQDLLDFADALRIETFHVVGHDWELEQLTSRRACGHIEFARARRCQWAGEPTIHPRP